MNCPYATFSDSQMESEIKSLHSALFWLLIYKDPKTSADYVYVDVDDYIKNLMIRFGGLNELFGESPVMVTLMGTLQCIRDANKEDPFNYRTYRKLVLDAQSLVDKLSESWGDTNGV